MTAPPWFESLPEAMGEADYRALPEEIARRVEVVHGHVIKLESPAPQHNRIARRLAGAFEAARTPADPRLSVETYVDVVLWRSPRFTVRRPDVVVYRSTNTRAVVEVSSPGTVREDLTDKRVQYATAGIPLYLLVMLDEKYEILEIREFHLDAAACEYRLHQVHRTELDLELPVRVTVPFPVLTAP